ncbi:MAG: hypothetical protein DI551_07280 [Micavibrio aeruginosavorus]|uniref:Lipoprotein n=1 Tax=Micavibrio aeruginosavorus TaxID=349221 RepID=A0A2W5MVY3_9BACT|nr:MAG: hypothetical protein DI551_07280 [Micavibrio aeruginosavorus]
MNYKSFVCMTSMAAFLLVACTKENPLEKHPPEAVAQYIFENSRSGVGECVKAWSTAKATNEAVLARCEPHAIRIAGLLNVGGFGPNISSENIRIPEVWQHVIKLYEKQAEESRERSRQLREKARKNLPFLNKINPQ